MNQEVLASHLTAHGVMPTAQRLDIAGLVLAEPQHLSAEQIIASLRRSGSRVSKATVYNTLNLFCDKGLLRTVEIDPVRKFYDSRIEPHHHYFNVDTGELTDIPLEAVELNIAAELPPGTESAGVEVVIRVRGRRPEQVPG